VSGSPSLSTTATTNSPVGVYPITVTQGTLSASNYVFSFVNGSLTVTSSVPVITWTPVGPIIYGTPLGTNQNNATLSVPGTASYGLTNGTVLPVGTNLLSVTYTPADTNYAPVSTTRELVVMPATLTVTADSQTRAFGEANGPLTYAISGFVNGETTNVVSGSPSLSTTATTNSPVGVYPITVTQGTLAASNYVFSFVNGNLTVIPSADVAVFVKGPATVNPGQTFTNIVTVTNLGPSSASNVLTTVLLPTNGIFVSVTGGATLTNSTLIWPPLPFLPNGGATNFLIVLTAPTNGSLVTVALATASTSDPNPANNDGSNAGTLSTLVVPVQFGVRAGTNVFNPQTGLFEQTVVVTNNGTATVAAIRLLVGDFASTNGAPRTNVWLWNAHGTNFDGRRFVQYNAPLDPGQFVSLKLEYYNPTRVPFTNSITIEATLPVPSTNLTGGVVIDRAFVDGRETGNPRVVIEWTSWIGTNYTVIYAPTPTGPWTPATPSVTATGTRVQWYDDGPPKTATPPLSVTNRFYRVIQNP
ncbi:MAG: MBG domain-containing protein, partial [Limisphaerales bacterium]